MVLLFTICFWCDTSTLHGCVNSHLASQLQYVAPSGEYEQFTSNSSVSQMCELEVGMSLVKVMTNGKSGRELGWGWALQHGVQIC